MMIMEFPWNFHGISKVNFISFYRISMEFLWKFYIFKLNVFG